MTDVIIDPLSAISLHLEMFFDTTNLGSATGFIIKDENVFYLVTNWHVVSGRHPHNKAVISNTGAIPNKIKIWHHKKGLLGAWIAKEYDLIDAHGNEIWKEHSFPNGSMADVVLVPLNKYEDVDYYDLDSSLGTSDLLVSPSEPVSIIGFPFGKASDGKFPIWKIGHVASDIDLNFNNKPIFLIDATTKPGMSGSPVVAKRIGTYTIQGAIAMGSASKFMGVYSGRTQDDANPANSNLGMVWKPEVINILLGKKFF